MKTVLLVVTLWLSLSANPLSHWNNGPLKTSILHFIADITDSSSKNFVTKEKRRAFFDLDGTLICEKPTYTEVAFITSRILAQIKKDSTLLRNPLYKVVYDNDTTTINTQIKEIILEAYLGESLETVGNECRTFLTTQHNPVLKRPYISLLYLPMIELITLLKKHHFDVYIVSTSQQEYIRCFTPSPLPLQKREVISTMVGFTETSSDDGIRFTRIHKYFTPYCEEKNKVVRIRERGLLPGQLAVGNTMGDFPMLDAVEKSGTGPTLQLIVEHDDAKREFDYCDSVLVDSAKARVWGRISMKRDFVTIFAP